MGASGAFSAVLNDLSNLPAAVTAAQQARDAAQAARDGAVVARAGAETARDVVLGSAREGLTWPSPGSHLGGLTLFEGDSTTDGAAASSWRTSYERSARGALGDGGPGFHLFTNGTRVDRGVGAGWSKFNAFAAGDGSTLGTLFYGGLATSGDGATFGWAPASRWDEATFFYLIQPGGGTATVRVDTNPNAQSVALNTGNLAPDGSGAAATDFRIGSLVLPNVGGASTGLSVSNTVGSVVILGADFRNTSRPRGFRYGNLAAGGKKLSDYAGLRDDLRRQFYGLLAPAALAINLGMNDRGTASAADHQTQLTALVTATQVSSPATSVWIVQSNEPGDAATTNFLSYVAVKRAVAKARKAGYIDLRTVLGNFATATDAGLMADGVHLNADGNERVAGALLTAMGFPAAAADPGGDPYTVVAAADNARGTLTQKKVTLAAGALTQTIYNLGVASNFSAVLFEIEVFAVRTGTSGHSLQTFRFLVQNGNAGAAHPGKATSAAAVTSAVLYQNNPGDGGLQAATIAVTITGEKAQVDMTGAFPGPFVITGRWLSASAGVSGRRVWEL